MEICTTLRTLAVLNTTTKKKVMCKGVMRKGMDGITSSILKEVGGRNYQIYICGTVKGVRRGYYLYWSGCIKNI